jgi:hypothetical protein
MPQSPPRSFLGLLQRCNTTSLVSGASIYTPTEDVALFRLDDDDYTSPFVVGQRLHRISAEYRIWGYPEDLYMEKVGDKSLPAALVFSGGHVRRRVNYEIERIPGSHFYELSTPAGAGCSGAAVSIDGGTEIDAIYVGERRNETNTFAVGYATRSDVLAERWPQLVDEEADKRDLCPLP